MSDSCRNTQMEGKLPFKDAFEEVVQGKYIHLGNCPPPAPCCQWPCVNNNVKGYQGNRRRFQLCIRISIYEIHSFDGNKVKKLKYWGKLFKDHFIFWYAAVFGVHSHRGIGRRKHFQNMSQTHKCFPTVEKLQTFSYASILGVIAVIVK